MRLGKDQLIGLRSHLDGDQLRWRCAIRLRWHFVTADTNIGNSNCQNNQFIDNKTSGGVKIMAPVSYSRFIRFLQEELSLSQDSIAIAERSQEQNPGPLPMILWQYGLVTLEELNLIFDWLETA